MKPILLILSASFAIILTACQPESASKQSLQPNIVYILADDLGYGELGSYGQKLIETPNIDKLATEGMSFTQHYAGAPVCAPSRCVLLTGKHTGHAYIRGNDEMTERGDVWDFAAASNDPNLEGQRPIPAGTATIGTMLQHAGYKTGIIGKWGLGGPLTEGIPNKQGFDFFYGYNCQRQAHTYNPLHLWKNEQKVMLNNLLVAPRTKLDSLANPNDERSYAKFNQQDYSPVFLEKEALSFIQDNKDHPFFLLYASPQPHVPLQAPQNWVKHYQKKLGTEEPYLGDKGYFPNRTPNATYAAMISDLDEQVGAIVAKLKELGLYDNTLIIFTSDNGPTYAGGVGPTYFNSAGKFNEAYGWGKGFVNEGGIRVPFIASWPGKIKPNTTSDLISSFYDMMPTFAELGHAITPDSIDGISIVPTLLSEGNQSQHPYLFWDYPEYGGQQAVRMGKWKGIRKDIKKGNLEIELYDLSNDIKEENNIAAENPEIVAKIREIMVTEHTKPKVATFNMAALGDKD